MVKYVAERCNEAGERLVGNESARELAVIG
jgi:hypothetical protein